MQAAPVPKSIIVGPIMRRVKPKISVSRNGEVKTYTSSEATTLRWLREEQGLEIYEPNLAAFRSHVQKMYLETDASKPWPAGVLDKINSLGN